MLRRRLCRSEPNPGLTEHTFVWWDGPRGAEPRAPGWSAWSDTSGHARRGSARAARRPPPVARDANRRPAAHGAPRPPRRSRVRSGSSGRSLLLRAAHPRQALLTALALAGVAAVSGRRRSRGRRRRSRPSWWARSMIGWHNDLVDRERDRADERPASRSPTATLDPGTVWFAIACGALLVVPLSIAQRRGRPGGAYLIALAVGLLGNVLFRRGWLSWLTWAVSFGLYPAFLSYGGWGGEFRGRPADDRGDRAGRRARRRASTSCARCPAWSPTTATAADTFRCGWRCGSGRRGCCTSSIAAHRRWSWRGPRRGRRAGRPEPVSPLGCGAAPCR